jgi:hypothetical protein
MRSLPVRRERITTKNELDQEGVAIKKQVRRACKLEAMARFRRDQRWPRHNKWTGEPGTLPCAGWNGLECELYRGIGTSLRKTFTAADAAVGLTARRSLYRFSAAFLPLAAGMARLAFTA